jgi:hypothetical protein
LTVDVATVVSTNVVQEMHACHGFDCRVLTAAKRAASHTTLRKNRMAPTIDSGGRVDEAVPELAELAARERLATTPRPDSRRPLHFVFHFGGKGGELGDGEAQRLEQAQAELVDLRATS